MNNQYCVLFTTAGSIEEASRIAEQLVEQHLVACVNIIPSIQSVYWWDNQVCKDTETLLMIKTLGPRVDNIKAVIREIHSYQTPELISLPIQDGLSEYLEWIEKAASGKAGK